MSENNGTVVVRADQLQRVLTLLAERRFVLERGRDGAQPWKVFDTDVGELVVCRHAEEKAALQYRQWLVDGAVAQMLASLKAEVTP